MHPSFAIDCYNANIARPALYTMIAQASPSLPLPHGGSLPL